MALTILSAEENSSVTSVDSTWVSCATIASGSFTGSVKYLVIASGLITCEANAGEHHIRLIRGASTEFTDSHAVYDPGAGANGAEPFHYMTVFTQAASAEALTIEIMREASTGDVTSGWTQIVAIDLTNLVENTDYWYNEVTADYTTTVTPTAQAAVTLTPNGTDNFWVIGNLSSNGARAVADGNDLRCQLYESVAASTTPLIDLENEDADAGDETRIMCLSRTWAAPSNASRTWSMRPYHGGSSAFTVLSTRIFVLRLNALRQHAVAYTAAGDRPSASPTWETEATVSVTPDYDGTWFALGFMTDAFSGTSTRGIVRFQHNNSGAYVSVPNYGDDEPSVATQWDATDSVPMLLMMAPSLTSGASRTINIDRTENAATLTVSERSIVAFSALLSGEAGASGHPATKRFGGVAGMGGYGRAPQALGGMNRRW